MVGRDLGDQSEVNEGLHTTHHKHTASDPMLKVPEGPSLAKALNAVTTLLICRQSPVCFFACCSRTGSVFPVNEVVWGIYA